MATFARGHWAQKANIHNAELISSIGRHTISTTPGRLTWILTASDSRTLRGIPAIGRSVRGAIPGTDPEDQATK